MEEIYFYTDDITYFGGVERVILNLSNEFIKKKKIVIISNTMSSEIKYEYNKKIEFISLNLKRSFFLTRKLEIIIKMNKLLKNKSGIILGMGAWNAIVLAFIKNKKFVKIASEHLAFNKIPKRTMLLRKILYRFLDGITILTSNNLKEFKALKNKVYIIPNFINFNNEKEVKRVENQKVISVGRLENQKGYDILLHIWEKVEKQNSEWILEIYGDGSKKEELLGLKKKLKLQRVEFMGITKETTKKMELASIYVMSSRYEGFPLVLLEAFSCGLPCISFDCESGPREIIKDGVNGYLIKENDIENYAKKILFLINDKKLRDEMSSKTEIILLQYSKDKIIKEWYDMFYELKMEKK